MSGSPRRPCRNIRFACTWGRTRLHVMHSPPLSFSLSPVSGRKSGERFSQKHAKYPAGCADTRDTRKERKAEFRKLIQPPHPPISLMVISNREGYTFYDAPDLLLGMPSKQDARTKGTVTDIRRFQTRSILSCFI